MHGFGQGYVIIFTEEINLGCITKIILRITEKRNGQMPIHIRNASLFKFYICKICLYILNSDEERDGHTQGTFSGAPELASDPETS